MSPLTVSQPLAVAQSTSLEFTPAELERFQQDGYIIVRQLAEAGQQQQMLEATMVGLAGPVHPVEFETEVQYPGAPASRTEHGGDTIRRLKEAHARHPAFTQWITHPKLVHRLQQLLGPRVVMPLAHHNCVMTKHPKFSSETHWHQDIRYWSFQTPELISVWLALGHENQQNGCLYVIPGTHRMNFTRDQFDDRMFFRADHPENQRLINTQIPVELEPGDTLLFHCKTLHAAGRNTTNQSKYSVVFTFRSADNAPLPGSRSAGMAEILLPNV